MIPDSVVWKTLTSQTQDSSPTYYTHLASLPLTRFLHMKHTHSTFLYMCCQGNIGGRLSGDGFTDISFPDGWNCSFLNPRIGLSNSFVPCVCFVCV